MYWANENQIETVSEGIQRNLCDGDEEEFQRKKSEQANMCMAIYFKEIKENDIKGIEEEIKNDIRTELKENGNNNDLLENQVKKEFMDTHKSEKKKIIQNRDMAMIA